MVTRTAHLSAAEIVRQAGGQLIGRTRLQKVTYLAQLAGFGEECEFEYRHYGPFSDDLARGIEIASGLGLVEEEEKRAEWGGKYSIYRSTTPRCSAAVSDRSRFIATAAQFGAVELELAATAAFLYAQEGIGRILEGDPWAETVRRKPGKAADGRLEAAKGAYKRLRQLHTPVALPPIV